MFEPGPSHEVCLKCPHWAEWAPSLYIMWGICYKLQAGIQWTLWFANPWIKSQHILAIWKLFDRCSLNSMRAIVYIIRDIPAAHAKTKANFSDHFDLPDFGCKALHSGQLKLIWRMLTELNEHNAKHQVRHPCCQPANKHLTESRWISMRYWIWQPIGCKANSGMIKKPDCTIRH